ncbi:MULTISPECIES: ABC transporter ATP-binding protein [unclassified Sporolactobacillus]|uniref:ABC transporter ATP-binding protein n=1 Tax=unclassified Sporolactobacillus TaxID=2628533 RepID=UPI00236863A7|nr:ATP-binding cassette domain-containing protein [Sporolactobacillus sp. CQH2019]MDD9150348.1 ATP-binding cassette domain-containing protein [Sporolactobacillus sp. CQH2019]
MKKSENFLQLNHIAKSYQDLKVLEDVTLRVKRGEFIAIIGKSGCGKTTLLRLIAGLETATGGSIIQDDVPLQGINRSARVMFQNGRLLPWKKVIDNVGVGLKGEWKDAARKMLRHVGLEEWSDQYPAKLSGGQKQRVALVRALVHQPDLLLLDEPLSALDALTRLDMQDLVESIWEAQRLTAILVTHDVEEAVRLADRVILLEKGRISLDIPIDLIRPRKRFNPKFGRYVEEILAKIIHPNQLADSSIHLTQ